MVSALDILGSLFQNGMTTSTADRLEHSLGEKGVGGQGGILDEILRQASGKQAAPAPTKTAPAPAKVAPAPARTTAAPAGGATGADGGLGGILGSILGDSQNLKTGALGAIAGALLGGKGKSMKGAMGGGALAVLGSIALKALLGAGGKQAAGLKLDPATKLSAGLRAPENDQEEQHLESVGQLLVKAMVNAAKADGRVDEDELKRIMGNAEKDGVNPQAREFLGAELRKPMDTDGLVRAAASPQVAAQVYAASLLAIEVDTPQEEKYLSELAGKLDLNADVVRHIHSAVGIA